MKSTRKEIDFLDRQEALGDDLAQPKPQGMPKKNTLKGIYKRRFFYLWVQAL